MRGAEGLENYFMSLVNNPTINAMSAPKKNGVRELKPAHAPMLHQHHPAINEADLIPLHNFAH